MKFYFRVKEKIAIINEFADNVFVSIQKLLIQEGSDPLRLPEKSLKVNYLAAIS